MYTYIYTYTSIHHSGTAGKCRRTMREMKKAQARENLFTDPLSVSNFFQFYTSQNFFNPIGMRWRIILFYHVKGGNHSVLSKHPKLSQLHLCHYFVK